MVKDSQILRNFRPFLGSKEAQNSNVAPLEDRPSRSLDRPKSIPPCLIRLSMMPRLGLDCESSILKERVMATSKKDSKKASKLLKGGKSKDERSVAGSALSQSSKKGQKKSKK